MWISIAIQMLPFQFLMEIQSVDGSFMRESTVKGNTGIYQFVFFIFLFRATQAKMRFSTEIIPQIYFS
jgi:hypothetical protein